MEGASGYQLPAIRCGSSAGAGGAVEFAADHAGEAAGVEGFGQERSLGAGEVIGGVAGHEDDAEAGLAADELAGEIGAGEAGHDHVGEDELNGSAVLLEEGEGLVGAVGFDDAVAPGFEENAGDARGGGLVFDDEDGLCDGGAGAELVDEREELGEDEAGGIGLEGGAAAVEFFAHDAGFAEGGHVAAEGGGLESGAAGEIGEGPPAVSFVEQGTEHEAVGTGEKDFEGVGLRHGRHGYIRK